MKKRLFGFTLCLFLILGLTACVSDSGSPEQTNNQTTNQTTAEAVTNETASGQGTTEEAAGTFQAIASKDQTVNLTFVTVYGDTIATKQIKQGEIPDLSDIKVPDMAGLAFDAWYFNRQCTDRYSDDVVLAADTTLYAGMKSNGTSQSAYEDALPADTSFVLYSDVQITKDTLADFITFKDVYDGGLTLSMDVIEEKPDLSAEALSSVEEKDRASVRVTGSYRYRLYAKDGFAPGGLYSITLLQNEEAFLLSYNDTPLTGTDATILNFKIAEEKVDNRKENSAVITLNAGDCKKLTPDTNGKASAVISSSVSLKKGDVIHIAKEDSGSGGSYYKIVSVGSTKDGTVQYSLTTPDTDEVWDEYELNVDSSDITDSTYEAAPGVNESTLKHDLETSIGYAAYIDAVLDSVRKSPEVQEQLAHVSQEDYDRVMSLTAVDFGFGPEELQAAACDTTGTDSSKGSTDKTPEKGPGEFNLEMLMDERGIINGLKATYSNKLTFTIGKNEETGLKGTVSLGFSLSENCSFRYYAAMIKKNKLKYPSMTDDYTQDGVIPTTITEFKVSATMKLGKEDDPKEDKVDYKAALGLSNAPAGVDSEKDINIAAATESQDLWVYIKKMKEAMAGGDALYNVNLDYVDLLDKEIGKINLTCTGIDSIEIVFHLKIGLAAQLNLTSSLKYTYMCDCYTTNGKRVFEGRRLVDIIIYPEDEGVNGKQVLKSDLEFTIALQGAVGIRAGLELEVNFSGFQLNDLFSIGISAEAGPYFEFRGFFAFQFRKTFVDFSDRGGEASGYSESSFKGGAMIETGIYLEVKAKIKLIKVWEVGLASYQWPLKQVELGAWNSKSGIYGDFVDTEETIALDGGTTNRLDLYHLSDQSHPVESKIRSTVSDTAYPLEDTIGAKNSSGVLLLHGDMNTGEVTTKRLTDPKYAHAYIYTVTSITITKNDGRNYDGRLKIARETITDTDKIARYAYVTTNGVVVFAQDCPDVVATVNVKAFLDEKKKSVSNVFTTTYPEKVFRIQYTSYTSSKTPHYNINFYDTDGNLLVTDTYLEGAPAIEFAAPGYTHSGTYTYLQTETGKARYAGDVTWDKIVGYFWGYDYYTLSGYVSPYDYSTAFWSDVPMSSGEKGNVVTAESVGKMTKDVNVYLHMTAKGKGSWIIYYVDPDNPKKFVSEKTVKEADLLWNSTSEFAALAPEVEPLQVDGKESGALEKAGTWNVPTETKGVMWDDGKYHELITPTSTRDRMAVYTVDDTYNEQGVWIKSTYRIVTEAKRQVPRAAFTAGQTTAVIDKYTWGTARFDYNGTALKVKTDVGRIPVVPEEYRNLKDICGWSTLSTVRAGSGMNYNYSTLLDRNAPLGPVALTKDDLTPVYYACPRRGTTISTDYLAVTQESGGKFTLIKKLGTTDTAYSQLGEYETAMMRAAITDGSSSYLFDHWETPAQDDFENGIIPEAGTGLASYTKAADGTLYLDAGQHYPLTAVYVKHSNTRIVLDASGIGTLSGGYASWHSAKSGRISMTFSSDNTSCTVAWTPIADADNLSSVGMPELFNNGSTVPTSISGWNWYWQSTDPVNGAYLKIAYNAPLSVASLGIPAGETVTFRPVFENRIVTINIPGLPAFTMTGKVGEQITAASVMAEVGRQIPKNSSFGSVYGIQDAPPLPYTFGSKDTAAGPVYTDSITVYALSYANATLTLYDTAALPDGRKGEILLNGPMGAVIDLTAAAYTPFYNGDKNYTEYNGIQTRYKFDGWIRMGTTAPVVTSMTYGEWVYASFSKVGEFAAITLDAGDGKFADGSSSKVLDYDLAKSPSSQTGYEAPSRNGYTFSGWAWEGTTAIIDTGIIDYQAGTSGRKKLVAQYTENEYNSVSVTGWSGTYDGTAHTVAAAAAKVGSTLYYSTTGTDGWTTTAPTVTDVGSMTVYVKATKAGYADVTGSAVVTVTHAAVTVKANDLSKVTGAADPTLTATVTGLVNGETAADKITYTLSRATGEAVGDYAITASGTADQGNYHVTFEDGKFTIRATCNVTYQYDPGKNQALSQGYTLLTKSAAPVLLGHSLSEYFSVIYNSVGKNGTLGDAGAIPKVWLYGFDDTAAPINISGSTAVSFRIGTYSYTAATLAEVTITGDTTIDLIITPYIITYNTDSSHVFSNGKASWTTPIIPDAEPDPERSIPQIYKGTEVNSANLIPYDNLQYSIGSTAYTRELLLKYSFTGDITVTVSEKAPEGTP